MFYKAWIDERLRNPNLPFGETATLHRDSYAELEQALSMIPTEMKESFLKAIECCPKLVETESDPVRFLRRERFNPWAAALRLCLYWNLRSEIFGDRAYLPMQLGETEGALVPEDLKQLRAEFRAILPKDKEGHPVVMFDRSKSWNFEKSFSEESRTRVTFFLGQLASEDEVSQQDGVVHLTILPKEGINGLRRAPIDVVHGCLPIRLKTWCLVQSPEVASKVFLENIIPDTFRFAGTLLSKVLVPIHGDSKDEILQKLLKRGFAREGLPQSLGGTWLHETWAMQTGLTNASVPTSAPKPQVSGFIPHSENRPSLEMQSANALVDLSAGVATVAGGVSCEQAELVKLDEALHYIPHELKQEYLQVIREAPDLVKLESDPARFLRCTNGDASAAAQRIVTYWARRKSLLGSRAFLPLNLSGKGALSDEAVEVAKSGFLCLLPDDSEGRGVFCVNKDLYPQHLAHSPYLKACAIFYVAHAMSGNELSLSDGVSSLHVMGYPMPEKPPATVDLAVDLFRTALPVRLVRSHFICIRPINGVSSYFGAIFRTVRRYFAGPKVWIHVGESGAEVMLKLGAFGYSEDGVPSSIGGKWIYEQGDQRGASRKHRKRRAESPLVAGSGPADTGDGTEPPTEPPRLPIIESDDMVRKAMAHVEEAIAALPETDKEALLEARRCVPQLVEHESPALRFLRFAGFDPWSAAARLAKYWSIRLEIFRERAFLPMNQSGEGALSREDMAIFSTGYMVLLREDKKGRTVVCYDSSRCVSHDVETRKRLTFYFFSIVAENEVSQRDGVVIISILSKPILDRGMRDCGQIVNEGLPVRRVCVHIVSCPAVSQRRSFVETMVPVMMQLLSPFIARDQTVIHTAGTQEALADSLSRHDIEIDSLPKSLGGQWGYEKFSQWQELRLRYEWELPARTHGSKYPGIPPYHVVALTDMTEDQKVERKRRMNVLHSRRRRERERVEAEVYSDQVAELRDSNRKLEQERQRLEQLMQSVRTIVAEHEASISSLVRDPRPGQVVHGSQPDAACPQPMFPTALQGVDPMLGTMNRMPRNNYLLPEDLPVGPLLGTMNRMPRNNYLLPADLPVEVDPLLGTMNRMPRNNYLRPDDLPVGPLLGTMNRMPRNNYLLPADLPVEVVPLLGTMNRMPRNNYLMPDLLPPNLARTTGLLGGPSQHEMAAARLGRFHALQFSLSSQAGTVTDLDVYRYLALTRAREEGLAFGPPTGLSGGASWHDLHAPDPTKPEEEDSRPTEDDG